MKKTKIVLFSTLIGGIIGYIFLSPVSMFISDSVHSNLTQDHLYLMHNSIWVSLTETFSSQFKIWAISHAIVGLFLGFVMSLFLIRVSRGHYLLIKDKEKRIAALEAFQSEVKEWEEEVAELKSEVNELLLELGKTKRY